LIGSTNPWRWQAWFQRGEHDVLDLVIGDRARRAGLRLVGQATQPGAHQPRPPRAHCVPVIVQLSRHHHVRPPGAQASTIRARNASACVVVRRRVQPPQRPALVIGQVQWHQRRTRHQHNLVCRRTKTHDPSHRRPRGPGGCWPSARTSRSSVRSSCAKAAVIHDAGVAAPRAAVTPDRQPGPLRRHSPHNGCGLGCTGPSRTRHQTRSIEHFGLRSGVLRARERRGAWVRRSTARWSCPSCDEARART
jgi:hypothetical protein